MCISQSWVFNTSLAYSGDETTMVETSPSFRCIKGPYFADKSLSRQWGREPTMLSMFPMIGSFHGPGGKFGVEADFFFIILCAINIKMKMEKWMWSKWFEDSWWKQNAFSFTDETVFATLIDCRTFVINYWALVISWLQYIMHFDDVLDESNTNSKWTRMLA